MAETQKNTDNLTDQSRVYVLFYTFFLVPLMITVFGVLFFVVVKFVTYESGDPYHYLNQIKVGSASKRWQSAYELSKILSADSKMINEKQFKLNFASSYEKSIHDDNKVRMYLALAMGKTEDLFYGPYLLRGLDDSVIDSKLAAIKSLGLIRYAEAIPFLIEIINTSKNNEERLAATISLGQIGSEDSIVTLENLLMDDEPNIRWDAAIALAKMGNRSGSKIIEMLLTRQYYDNFKEVDSWEQEQAILVAINVASNIKNPDIHKNLEILSKTDKSMKVRDAAFQAISRYGNGINNG